MRRHPRLLLGLLSATAAFGLAAAPSALAVPASDSLAFDAAGPADPMFDLCAKTGTVELPGGVSFPIWGFASKPAGVECDDPALEPALPGPPINVNEGDPVTVNVTNLLPEAIALEFPGIAVDQGAAEAPADGGTAQYAFTATRRGTFLYQSLRTPHQVALGLAGALVVRQAGVAPGEAGQAYEGSDASEYDTDALVVLNEIDPELNALADPDPATNPATFAMTDWTPTYWLVNGRAYPDTRATPIAAAADSSVLARYVSAGPENVTMTLLGTRSTLLAKDAHLLAAPVDVVSETFPAGETADALVSIPASAAAGDSFPLYNRQLQLTNGPPGAPEHAPGGQLTAFQVPRP